MVAVDRRLHVQPGARAGPEAAFDARSGLLDLARGEESAHLVHHTPEVLGVDDRRELGADEILGVPPVDARGGRADVSQRPVRRGDHDDVAGALDQGAEVVLLLRQFLSERDVVEQHDALAHDERQDDRACREEHDAVHPVPVQQVVENAQRADGGGQIRGERGERAGDRPRVAHLVAATGPERVLLLAHTAPRPHPRRVREQQRAGEPAGVQDLARAVAGVQQRRGEQRVAHHREGERADRGVHRRTTPGRAPEVQREHHADQRDVEQRVREGERGAGDALALELGGVREGEAPGEGDQGAGDEPGVEREADPAGLGDGPPGQDEQADDGGRREAEEEQVGEARRRHRLAQDDLVPAPHPVAEAGHERGEREQEPGGSKAAATAARVHEIRYGGDRRREAQAEVAHDQGESVGPPADRRPHREAGAQEGEEQLGSRTAPLWRADGGLAARVHRGAQCCRRRGVRTHRAAPVRRAAPVSAFRCPAC